MDKSVKIILASLISFLALLMFLFVTREPVENEKSTLKPPVISNMKENELILMGSYRISSGFLYQYKLNNDTIYIVEGGSSSYPISISIK